MPGLPLQVPKPIQLLRSRFPLRKFPIAPIHSLHRLLQLRGECLPLLLRAEASATLHHQRNGVIPIGSHLAGGLAIPGDEKQQKGNYKAVHVSAPLKQAATAFGSKTGHGILRHNLSQGKYFKGRDLLRLAL